MIRSFENFSSQVKTLCGNKGIEQWLNNREACELLKISQRTLQSCRDTGIFPYSQIGHKCYYKVADVEKLINQSQNKKE
jgi:predicted site-specific integrase-resolvase